MKVKAEHVENTLGELWEVDEVRTDYVGRGMYGKTCLGLVTDVSGWQLATAVFELLATTDWAEEEEFIEYLLSHEPRVYSMGLGTIYYWPGLQVENEEE